MDDIGWVLFFGRGALYRENLRLRITHQFFATILFVTYTTRRFS